MSTSSTALVLAVPALFVLFIFQVWREVQARKALSELLAEEAVQRQQRSELRNERQQQRSEPRTEPRSELRSEKAPRPAKRKAAQVSSATCTELLAPLVWEEEFSVGAQPAKLGTSPREWTTVGATKVVHPPAKPAAKVYEAQSRLATLCPAVRSLPPPPVGQSPTPHGHVIDADCEAQSRLAAPCPVARSLPPPHVGHAPTPPAAEREAPPAPASRCLPPAPAGPAPLPPATVDEPPSATSVGECVSESESDTSPSPSSRLMSKPAIEVESDVSTDAEDATDEEPAPMQAAEESMSDDAAEDGEDGEALGWGDLKRRVYSSQLLLLHSGWSDRQSFAKDVPPGIGCTEACPYKMVSRRSLT